jgi:hypothetical protein
MPASGRLDAHPPPLHSEFSVNDLSAVGDEVWAVGMHGDPAPALIAHTTGGAPWQLGSYSSSSKAVHTQLAGVHATASGDVWAVGWEGLFHSNTERTHIAHGDGTMWQPVESPDFGDGSHLSDVAACARDDAFAVGARSSHSSLPSGPLGHAPVAASDTLAVRWDGARWAAVPGPGRGTFHEVCAIGPGAYWAVGTTRWPSGRAIFLWWPTTPTDAGSRSASRGLGRCLAWPPPVPTTSGPSARTRTPVMSAAR